MLTCGFSSGDLPATAKRPASSLSSGTRMRAFTQITSPTHIAAPSATASRVFYSYPQSLAPSTQNLQTIQLSKTFQDNYPTARPETMYIHTSIDVAWICRSRCRNISEILEVAMSFHPESIPIPEVAVRLTAYITELMSVGIKRVCFDSHIWDTMIECEKCHLGLERAIGGFDTIIVDDDRTICEGSLRQTWASRASRAAVGVKLDASADPITTMF